MGRKDWLKGAASSLKQKWDYSQVEEDLGEGEEEVSEAEEKIAARNVEGKSLQVEGVQRAPELLVSQVVTKEKEPKKEKKKSKVVGWSTVKMEEKESKQEFKDTEEMVQCNQWRSIDPEVSNNVWDKLSVKLRKKCWRRYKVEESKSEAHKGRGEPSEWGMVQRVKNISLENGVKTAGRESLRGSGNRICSESKACRRARRKRRR